MRYHFLGLFLILLACNPIKDSDRIQIPSINESYYLQSVNSIESRIAENPNDIRLIRLQLSYLEKLDWPANAGPYIERATEYLRYDPLFIDQQIAYYQNNGLIEELYELVRDLEASGKFPAQILRYKIDMSIDRGDFSSVKNDLIRLFEEQGKEELAYVALRYVQIGDSVGAIKVLASMDDEVRLEKEYVKGILPTLIQFRQYDMAIGLIERYWEIHGSLDFKSSLAQVYYQKGDTAMAKSTIQQSVEREDQLLLAGWYEQESNWDSARYSLKKVIDRDSTDFDALLMMGNVDQKSGYFYRSLNYYNQLLEMDSTHQEVLDQIALVNRKIAYLQRIREAQKDIPVLDLSSKKANN